MVNLLEFLSGDNFKSAFDRLRRDEPISSLDRETITIGVKAMIEKISQDMVGLPQIRPDDEDSLVHELFGAFWIAKPGSYLCLYVDEHVHIHVMMMCDKWEVPSQCKVAFHITDDDDHTFRWQWGDLETVAAAWRLLKQRVVVPDENLGDLSRWVRDTLSTARGGPPAHAYGRKPGRPNSYN